MDLHSKQRLSLLISVTVVLFVTQRISASGNYFWVLNYLIGMVGSPRVNKPMKL